jgi:glutathione S-transferase
MGSCQGSDSVEKSTNSGMDIKIYYFDVYNRAEPHRMLLNHAGVSFEDVRIDMKDWMKLKPTMPDGVTPAIRFKHNGKEKLIGQSVSMLRFLGRVYGYYPADPLQAYKVDCFVATYADVIGKFYSGAMEKDPDVKAQKINDLFETYLPKVMKAAEEQLKSNGGKKFMFGDRLNIADFWYGCIYTNYFNNPKVAYGTEIW